jgi:hypothetical protein
VFVHYVCMFVLGLRKDYTHTQTSSPPWVMPISQNRKSEQKKAVCCHGAQDGG